MDRLERLRNTFLDEEEWQKLQNEEMFFSYRRYFLNDSNPHPRVSQVQWSGIAIA